MDKTNKQMLDDLKKINAKLKNSEKQLVALNQQLDASNQQLSATEQQLRAYNQQLEANGQQLRAANQQLIASEKTLKYEKEFSESLLETANTIIVTLDVDANIILFNKFAEELTGYKKEEVLGKNWFDIFIPKDESTVIPKVFRNVLMDMMEASSHTNPILIKDGSERLISWENTIVKNENGEISGILSIGNDITENKKTEKALIESELMLKEAEKIANVGSWYWEVEPDIVHWSDELFRITNQNPKLPPPTYAVMSKIYTPESWELLSAAVGKAVTDGISYNLELNMIRPDNEIRIVHTVGKAIQDNTGRVVSLYGMVQDITERKQSEQEIIDKNEQLELILQGGNLGWWDWDIPSGKEIYNEILAENLGYELSKIKPHINWWEDKIHPDDMKDVSSDLQNHFDGKTEYYENKHRLKTKSGEWKWFLDHGKVVEWDEDGKPIRMIGILRDINKLERSVVALRESEETYRNIFNNAQVGLFRTRIQDGKLLEVNKTLAKMSGYDSREQYIKEYDPKKEYVDAGTRERMLKEITSAGYVNNFEARFYNRDGSIMWASFSAKIFPDKGCIEGVLEDITDRKKSENKLKESENRFESFMNYMPAGIFIKDSDGYYLFSNKFNSNRFGIDNVEGKTVYDFFPKEIADEFTENDNKILNGDNLLIEGSVTDKDGLLFYYKNHQFAIDQADGKKLIGGISFDITKEKKAEEEILKLSTAVAQSPSVIAITNLKGNIEYVNPKFTELTGYTFEEARGLNPRVLKSGEQPDEMYKELWQTISSGKEWHGEFHNKKKNGELFWELASVSPIFDKQGKITNYIKVAEDISERKHSEQVQKVMYNISNAVSTTNTVEDLISQIQTELGTIIDTTNFFVAFYDSSTDMFSLPYYSDEKDSFTSAPASKTLSKYVIDTKKPLLADIKLKKKLVEEGLLIHQGSFSKLWLGVPLKTEGKVSGVFVVQSYTDENAFSESDMKMLEFISGQISISIDRKKKEQELITALDKATESERLKTAFLNNFSHEIRTPMNGILGFVELLKKPELSGEQQQQFIEIIETSSDRMLSTVDDLVNISMIESNQMKVLFSDININEQTKGIVDLLRLEAENKGLKLLLQNSLPDDAVEISTDSAKLYGILTNIVKNAIKFTHKGSIIFGYHLVGKNIEFFVSDSGIGIPKDRQTAIFDRFVKADIEDKAVFEGSGLGLTIAKAYVEMLGGNIWLESEEGIGSKFYFTIPHNPVKKELVKSEVKTPSEKSDSLPEKITILIVEDEEVVTEYLRLVLKDLSESLLFSSNGFEAVEICRNNPNIDLILMDIKMPIMNGYNATKQIRSFNKEVIIIAQTAYALKGDREKAVEVGCNDYISKPINKDELIEKIEEWF